MTLLAIYGVVALVILGLMTAIWILSLLLRNSSIVDIFWGAGFVVAGWVYFALTPDGFPARKWKLPVPLSLGSPANSAQSRTALGGESTVRSNEWYVAQWPPLAWLETAIKAVALDHGRGGVL